MKVSIIIPAYNASATLASTLYSVLAQSHEEWEAIIVDDGSQDDTAKIAKEFAARDRRIRMVSRSNGGEGAARNTGITAAQYDWLLFLDSDDWILPNYLARMTQALCANPALDAVHCKAVRVASDGTQVGDSYEPPEGDLFPVLARRAAFNVHACLVKKSIVQAVGGFDEQLERLPDWDLWQRVARTGAMFGAVREVLAYYRMCPHSVSLDAAQVLQDGLRVLKQGHAPDPRVPHPAPAHAQGLPPEGVHREEFYFLSWCAGLVIGSGGDARSLLVQVGEDHFPELYPDAVAECLFRAAPLPTCLPPQGWEQLWPRVHQSIKVFLNALEVQSQAEGLAARALSALKQMIRTHAPSIRLFFEEYESELAAKASQITELEQALRREREEQARRLAEVQQFAELEQQRVLAEVGQVQRRLGMLEASLRQLDQDRSAWQQRAEQAEEAWRGLAGHWLVRLGRGVKSLWDSGHGRSAEESLRR